MARANKGGGGKLIRSQVVTVRLDARLRFGAEILGRKQRRTLSSFIEWAVEEALKNNYLTSDATVLEALSQIWDVDEPDRFIKLADHYPDLLTHDEQVLWKLLRERGCRWTQGYAATGGIDSLDFGWIRKHWVEFKAVAEGLAEPEKLPKMQQVERTILNADIPF